MAGRVEIVLGDMFEGPSDLIVIPCSTIPSIAWYVENRLKHLGIPRLTEPMRPGEVRFADLASASELAPFVAFAAAVRQTHSEPRWIDEIASTIGSHVRESRAISLVACPLLGTGAGALRYDVAAAALISGFTRTGPAEAILRLFVRHQEVLSSLELARDVGPLADVAAQRVTTPSPPRVFISYSRSSDEHAHWVEELATALRDSGVNARLDVWHLEPGMNLPQWMANELALADRVLVIGDEVYAQKSDRHVGGVGWESALIQGDLYRNQASNLDKYIPIVVTPELQDGLPGFLDTVLAIHWPRNSTAEDASDKKMAVVQALFRMKKEPPVGPPPTLVYTVA